MNVEIVETRKLDLKRPVLVEGLPGLGLVGTIAAKYLVEKLGMEQVGYIESPAFPPMAAVHEGIPLHPARIYASKKYNLIILFSEFIIPMNAVYPFAQAILAWAQKKGVSKIISLGGIVARGEQDEVFGIGSTPSLTKELSKYGVKAIKEGTTTGVNGIMLANCAARGFPAVSLLAEAKADQMDPLGASMVIDALKKVAGIKIDSSDLEKESSDLQRRMADLLSKAKADSEHYRKVEGESSMYG